MNRFGWRQVWLALLLIMEAWAGKGYIFTFSALNLHFWSKQSLSSDSNQPAVDLVARQRDPAQPGDALSLLFYSFTLLLFCSFALLLFLFRSLFQS